MKKIFSFLLLGIVFFGGSVAASELREPSEIIHPVRVVEIRDQQTEVFTGQSLTTQTLRVRVTSGDRKGDTIVFDHQFDVEDFEMKKGDRLFLLESHDVFTGDVYYNISERNRTGVIVALLILFFAVVIGFGGKQGIRSIVGLAGSFLVVAYILIPGLLGGVPPVLLSLLVGTIILVFAIVVTHGWNRTSFIALGGTSLTLVITVLLALGAVELSGLTGFLSDEITFLNFNTAGAVDIKGLLLGGIIIGILGVLDDIAITQVAVVRQLWSVDQTLSSAEVFKRALSVGRDHMSSLVNTLILAYVGVGLPLVMLLRTVDTSFIQIINQEAVTAEIVRMLVGSIGLILCVPITTWLAVMFYKNRKDDTEEIPHTCAHGHVH